MNQNIERVTCPACKRRIGMLTRNGTTRIANHAPRALGKALQAERPPIRCPGSRTVIGGGA